MLKGQQNRRAYLAKLTQKQFEMLAHVLTEGYKNHTVDPTTGFTRTENAVIWSPKTFIGRSPTKAEAATLSKRMSNLIHKRLVARKGPQITLTTIAKAYMQQFIKDQNDQKKYQPVKKLLIIAKITEVQDTLTKLRILIGPLEALRSIDKLGLETELVERIDKDLGKLHRQIVASLVSFNEESDRK